MQFKSRCPFSTRHPLHLQLRRLQPGRNGSIPPRNSRTEHGRSVLGVTKSAPPPPGHLASATASAARVNCRAPVIHANHLGASHPCKSSRRQSSLQIISAPVGPSNHLGASQQPKSSRRKSATLGASRQPKSSRRKSATQIIADRPVSNPNHRGTRSALQMIVPQRRQGSVKDPLDMRVH